MFSSFYHKECPILKQLKMSQLQRFVSRHVTIPQQINVEFDGLSHGLVLSHELFVLIYSQLQNRPKFCRNSNLLLCSLASLPASALWYPADHSPKFPGTRKSSCFPLDSSANFFTMGRSTHFCWSKPSQRMQLSTPVKPRMTMELPQPQLHSQ